jgi:hypothetical protein
VPKVSANSFDRRLSRQLRRHALGAWRTLHRLDPKSVERSTIIGIALFAASSIALQGAVVISGSIKGRPAGMAEAAFAPDLRDVLTASVAARQDLDLAAVHRAPLQRADRLSTDALAQTVRRGHWAQPAGRVPADTVIAKSTSTSAVGLRTTTFKPGTQLRYKLAELASDEANFAMSPHVTSQGQPIATRVAYLGPQQARGIGKTTTLKDSATIIEVPPSSRPERTSRNAPRVPDNVVQKVHFQDYTPDRCLPGDLMAVIYDVAERFGEVQVLSTFRDPERNRRVGGAPQSFHLSCQAIDFRVMGRSPGLLEYLEQRADVGGLKRYPLGFYHIDTGPRRTW